ncbi:MAG: hypothetical protein VKI82_02335 [Leptolyngbya sp.]|nr:hypothetical protein [Leptolyngbya sp.]
MKSSKWQLIEVPNFKTAENLLPDYPANVDGVKALVATGAVNSTVTAGVTQAFLVAGAAGALGARGVFAVSEEDIGNSLKILLFPT